MTKNVGPGCLCILIALLILSAVFVVGNGPTILHLPVVQQSVSPTCVPGCTIPATSTPLPLCVTPTPAATTTPTPLAIDWQVPSSIPLAVHASGLSSAYWRLVAVRYEDEAHSGGRHNAYFRTEDEAGNVVLGVPVCLTWPSGQDCSHVTEGHDIYYPLGFYADYPLYGGSWNPADGPGSYNMFLSGGRSDTLVGLGLPFSQHVNYYATWRYVP